MHGVDVNEEFLHLSSINTTHRAQCSGLGAHPGLCDTKSLLPDARCCVPAPVNGAAVGQHGNLKLQARVPHERFCARVGAASLQRTLEPKLKHAAPAVTKQAALGGGGKADQECVPAALQSPCPLPCRAAQPLSHAPRAFR